MSETLPYQLGEQKITQWSNPNFFKKIKRLTSEAPIAYRVKDYQIEIEEYQVNTLERSASRIRADSALRMIRGESVSKSTYLANLAIAAVRSKVAPVNKGLLTIASTENPSLISLFPFIHYPGTSGRGRLYSHQDKNGLNLNYLDLLDMFSEIKSDRINNPYSLTDLELDFLAKKHRPSIVNLRERFASLKENESRILRIGAYELSLEGDQSLRSFRVSDPNLGYSQPVYNFEIFNTKYGPTISCLPTSTTSIHEVPFGDLDALRVPIDDGLLASLESNYDDFSRN